MKKVKFIRSFITIYLILFYVSFSCSKKDAHEFTTSINEQGVKICVNSGGPKYSGPLYDIEETLSLGGEEPEPKLFQPIDKCLVDDKGNIYFSDENRIKKFDPDGRFLQYIGNPGEGPGEVNYPSPYEIYGDSLIVGQYRWRGRGKYEIFNLTGNFINRIQNPAIDKKLLEDGRSGAEILLRNRTFIFCSSARREQGDYELNSYSYGLADMGGGFIRDLNIGMRDHPRSIVIRTETVYRGMSRPYVAGIQIKNFMGALYALLPEGKEIYLLTQSGELKQKILLNIQRQSITQEERENIKAMYNRPKNPLQLKDRHFPDYKPLACDLIVDDNRNIWLKKGDETYNYGKEPITYMILDEQGEYIADQTLPMNLSEVKHGYAYGFFVTEDDLRIFKRYKLKRRGK